MKIIKKISFITILLTIMMFASQVYAQTQTTPKEGETYNQVAGAMVFILVAFMFVLIFLLSSPKYHYSEDRRKKRFSFLAKISQLVNRGVPIEKEEEIKMDHGFDGIYELNNKIPPWFNILFYGTIVFAAVYLVDYHVLGSGNVMIDEYVQEVTVANQQREELIRTGAFVNENNVTMLTEAADIDKGKQIFSVNCTPCHGPDAGGTVGPNLTDQYWIHGGGIKNIFKTVKNGVPAKGMISWAALLTPKQMQQVSSYVLTLQGTKPPTGKAPEGNIWVETDSTKTTKDSVNIKDTGKVKIDTVKIKTDTSKIKTDTNKIKNK